MNHALSFFERGYDTGIAISSHFYPPTAAPGTSSSSTNSNSTVLPPFVFSASFPCAPASFGIEYVKLPPLKGVEIVAAVPFSACGFGLNMTRAQVQGKILLAAFSDCAPQVQEDEDVKRENRSRPSTLTLTKRTVPRSFFFSCPLVARCFLPAAHDACVCL